MTEYFNQKLSKRKVVRTEKNSISKSKTDLSEIEKGSFSVRADFQGKEMKLTFDPPTEKVLLVTFAKIGFIWYYDSPDVMTDYEKVMAQLTFHLDNGAVMCFMDKSRFMKWSWNPDYRSDRSPDITQDHNNWRRHIYDIRKHKAFNKPVFDLMLNPLFFNGVGNFSRAEILGRTRFSPFTPMREILESDILREDLFITCRDVLDDIYRIGGCQFQQWKNPFGQDATAFHRYIQTYKCYGKSYYCRDSMDRIFWFSKKWQNHYAVWANRQEDITDVRLLKQIMKKDK